MRGYLAEEKRESRNAHLIANQTSRPKSLRLKGFLSAVLDLCLSLDARMNLAENGKKKSRPYYRHGLYSALAEQQEDNDGKL